MVFSTTPFFIFFLAVLQNVSGLTYPQAPQELNCNRVTGDFNLKTLMFNRPLQIGDSITWNGTISSSSSMLEWKIYSTPSLNVIPFLVRQDTPNRQWSVYNSFIGTWGQEWYGQPMFVAGMPYQFTVKFIGTHFQLTMNNILMYSFQVRAPTDNMKALACNGAQSTNWVQMDCAQPLRTTPAPRPPHKGGYGGGKRPKGPIIGKGKFDSDESD